MGDIIENFGNSTIQHGKHSDRVYLMSLSSCDLPGVLTHLDALAQKHGYSKIFAKVPATAAAHFLDKGYLMEAAVPGLLKGEEGLFLGKYLTAQRREEGRPELVRDVLTAARAKASAPPELLLGSPYVCRLTKPEEAGQMAEVYRKVFATYPFPIHDPTYLVETMESHVHYYGIWKEGELIALASAEMDRKGLNAEMTDFATLPEARGQGLANYLLAKMEEEIDKLGIRTAYTIARAYSHGMNITFAKNGYEFCGTLTNNTDISGGLESMNVWFKPLEAQAGEVAVAQVKRAATVEAPRENQGPRRGDFPSPCGRGLRGGGV
jgi:putative beta-lysine N-acetyltransferase